MAIVLYLEGAHDGMSVEEFAHWFMSLNDTDLLAVVNAGLKYNKLGIMLLNSKDNLRGAINNFWGDDVINVLQHSQLKPSDFDSQFIFIDPYCETIDCYDRNDLEEFICEQFGGLVEFADNSLHIQLSEEE